MLTVTCVIDFVRSLHFLVILQCFSNFFRLHIIKSCFLVLLKVKICGTFLQNFETSGVSIHFSSGVTGTR